MFKGINIYGMMKNGTIAVITMLGVRVLFGEENIMLAFPIALTSAVMGRQNFRVKTYSKIFMIIMVDLIIVSLAFISRINPYLGIIVNLISIFLIIYVIVTPYDPTFYKPFIMLYVFTQYASIDISRLPLRYMSVIFGVLVIVLCNKAVNDVNEKKLLGNSISKSLKIIRGSLQDLMNDSFDGEKEIQCTNIMRDLAYKVYISRYRNYLTTKLGKIQFKLFMDIEHLNLFLRKIREGYSCKKISKEEINELMILIDEIIETADNDEKVDNMINDINKYINKYIHKSNYSYEICTVLINISKNISSLYMIKKKDVNKVYDGWERSYFDKTSYTFREYFRKDSIRFKFAMRMSITLSFALFCSEYLGFNKIIWAIITVMSVMQPYYEDTKKKSRERIIGNVIAVVFTGIIINIADNKYVTIAILVLSLYLLYAYKEYYKISLFAAVASICVSSLSNSINILIIYRVLYVLAGIIIVMAANRLIFPYRLKDGIVQLESKINMYGDKLIKEGKAYLNGNGSIHIIRDIIIHGTLMNQKLYLRNLQYGDEEVNKFIYNNNYFMVELGYAILMSYGKSNEYKKKKLEEVMTLYI